MQNHRKSSSPKESPGSSPTPDDLNGILRLIPGYDPFASAAESWLDEAEARKAIDFFHECLKHVEGAVAGKPFILELWQQAIIGNLFGWKRKDSQGRVVRRYREAFIFIPRKNGKTPLCAGICNYVLFCDPERGKQIFSAAAEKDQAALLYRHAKGMIEQEEELSSRARIYRAHKSVVLKDDEASAYRVLSADADTKHGGTPTLVLIDELHAQPNRDLVDVLQTSMSSANRLQPLLVHITTSDFDKPSICNEKHDYAGKVRDGIIQDESFLPVIYEAKPDEDWTDEETWKRANPNLGVSVSLDYMRRECKRAQETPSYENTFKRLHLNIKTQNDVRWLSMESWDACNLAVDPDALKGCECWGGLDLATTTDIAAFVLLFPEAEGGYSVLPHFFVPEENARKRERRDRVPYETWAKQGLITMTPGDVIDYDRIRATINELGANFDIKEIACDRWNATQIITQLGGDGFEMVPFGQGFKDLSAPTKELEKLVIARQVAHGGHPVLRWMASNVSVAIDAAGNLKPSKKKSTERIDGIVALIMSLGRAMVRPEDESVYDTRGILAV